MEINRYQLEQLFRVLAWKGLFNPTVSPATSNMDLNMQGWSNTPTPQSHDQKYNVALQNLPVNQLPSGITDNKITITIRSINI